MQENTILKIEHVSKFYPGVTALKDVSFTLQKGEVRALVGENGAGKSTLIKCIMGVERPDEGKITMNYNGEWVVNANAVDAQAHGVFANYQQVNIAPDLSIAENYFLGRQPKTKLGLVDWKKMARDSKKIIDKFEMGVDPLAKIRELPIAMQAMVTISKISVNEDIRLVIFDEPTALLENEKVDMLFRFIGELKSQGVSIIYISHRLEEIMQICDSVTILKDGSYVDTMPIENVTKDSLIQMMVGRPATDIYNIRHFDTDEELLRVENFSDSKHFKNINFTLHKGEILGFAGLVGAGRSEVMRALTAVEKRLSGDVYLKGKKGSPFQSDRRAEARHRLPHRGPPHRRLRAEAGYQDECQHELLRYDQQGGLPEPPQGEEARGGILQKRERQNAFHFAARRQSLRRQPAEGRYRQAALPRSRNPDL